MAPIPPHIPPALNHLVIFNPSLKPETSSQFNHEGNERNRDLEDDLAQAAQILFYTSHAERDVSRDVMLRQVGLVKGLMSFTDMLAPGDDPGFFSVNSQRARILVYSPEPNIFIYANIALARFPPDPVKGRGDPIPVAQGIPDGMLLDALRRGYDDFRLLHGPLPDILTSPDRTAVLDVFWTRFAFRFETTVLAPHPDPSNLRVWLGDFLAPSADIESAANRALDVFREDAEVGDIPIGVMSKDGPISRRPDLALARYLFNLVLASIPPPLASVDQQPPDQPEETRKSSWAGWVPSMSGMGLGSRSATPTPQSPNRKGRKVVKDAKPSRWPGLGLGGLGESLGSVGQAFNLSGKAAVSKQSSDPATSAVTLPEDADNRPADIGEAQALADHEVLQTVVSLGDLAAAQAEPELELVWSSRQIWLRVGEGYERRMLMWMIRDEILLYVIQPEDGIHAPPPTPATLSLFSKLVGVISPDDARSQDRSSSPVNSSIYSCATSVTATGPDMDAATAISLKELKHVLHSDPAISEVFARTSASRFIVGKQSKGEETYIAVGKKDASLVDANHALRSFERATEIA